MLSGSFTRDDFYKHDHIALCSANQYINAMYFFQQPKNYYFLDPQNVDIFVLQQKYKDTPEDYKKYFLNYLAFEIIKWHSVEEALRVVNLTTEFLDNTPNYTNRLDKKDKSFILDKALDTLTGDKAKYNLTISRSLAEMLLMKEELTAGIEINPLANKYGLIVFNNDD